MDEARKAILDWLMANPGQTLRSLSLGIGRNHAYLHQFVHDSTPKNLREDDRLALADLMKIDENRLRSVALKQPRQPTQPEPVNARVAGNVQLRSVIPAYGQAVGGKDGRFVLNGNKIADILAPPSLASVPDAYAVYVVGDSMEPRYHAGEVVFVNPRLPVRQNDYVVVQIAPEADGEPPFAYVKRFVSRTDKGLKLLQFSPAKTLVFPLASIVSIHRIVMGGEG